MSRLPLASAIVVLLFTTTLPSFPLGIDVPESAVFTYSPHQPYPPHLRSETHNISAEFEVTQISGAGLFGERCADCHGADATGVRGPDLTRLWGSGANDDQVFRTIRQGVPGSIMAASTATDEELRAIVAYLKSIGTAPSSERARGNAEHGQQIFWSTCGGCHRVQQRGGRLGPDLSHIAATQSREALRRAIREPSSVITPGYQAVVIVTRDGQQIRGARKGEDAFSVQIMDARERLQGYLKADVQTVTRETRSLMPEYRADRLAENDLDDLLQFLSTLRGPS